MYLLGFNYCILKQWPLGFLQLSLLSGSNLYFGITYVLAVDLGDLPGK